MAGRNLFAEEVIEETKGRNLFADSPPETPEQTVIEGTTADAIIEPAIAIGGALPATVGGGVAGIVQSLNPLAEPGAGERAVRSAQELIQPETQRGQESLANIMGFGEKVSDTLSGSTKLPRTLLIGSVVEAMGGDLSDALTTIVDVEENGIAKVMAEKVFEVTNSPLAATAVEMAPDVILALLPMSRLGAKGKIKRKQMMDDIKSGSRSRELAPVKIEKNKIVPDKEAIEAIRQGFDQSAIQAIKQSSKVDKANLKEMVDIFKKRKEDFLFAQRPIDVAGRSLVSRLEHIREINKKAGADIDRIANTVLKGKEIDISGAVNGFGKSLDDLGIKIVRGKKGFEADYTDSILPPGDRGAINEVIRQMDRIGKKGPPDAQQAHVMKRIIDNNVTFGKTQDGLSGDAERALKGFRKSLDDALDSKFPDYDKANLDYAETIGALDDIKSIAGSSVDLLSDSGANLLGQLTRRLRSNAVSRVALEDSIANIESIALKHGGKFDDNIHLLVEANKEFERMFGTVADTSLKGDLISGGVELAKERTLSGAALNQVGKGVSAMRGIDEESAIKSIEAILNRN